MDASRYKIIRIPKKKGGFRILHEPDPALKAEQRSMLRWLRLIGVRGSNHAHAFARKRSIKTAAEMHVGKRVVMRVDIKDFFPSIKKWRIVEALMREGVSDRDANEIGEKCTCDDFLPQGAPTSPLLSNIVAKQLDRRLAGLCKSFAKRRKLQTPIYYSRYADDLIFSSDYLRLNSMLPAIYAIIKDEGFAPNRGKTKIMRRARNILGLAIDSQLSTRRKYRKNLRASLHQLFYKALKGEASFEEVRRIRGKIAFVEQINPPQAKRLLERIKVIEKIMEALEFSRNLSSGKEGAESASTRKTG